MAPGPDRPAGWPGLVTARSFILTLFSIEVAALVVSGIALFFVYRPSVGQAWNDVSAVRHGWDLRITFAARFVHRLASVLAVFNSVALGIVAAIRSGSRRWPGWAVGAGLVVTTLLASVTGYLLPWDQLALWAVRVGANTRGYGVVFDSARVRFVLVGGTEVTRTTFVRWLLVHTVVLAPALISLLVLAWRRHRAAP